MASDTLTDRQCLFPPGTVVRFKGIERKVTSWGDDGSLTCLESDGETVSYPAAKVAKLVIFTGGLIDLKFSKRCEIWARTLDLMKEKIDEAGERAVAAFTSDDTPRPAMSHDEIEMFLRGNGAGHG